MNSRFLRPLLTFLCLSIPAFTFAEPANLALAFQEVKAYHDTGTYQKDLNIVIKKADSFITQKAEQNNKTAHPKKLAIVLDIDETSLSNYQLMLSQNFIYSKSAWEASIHAAKTPAIQPMLSLYEHALKQGVSVFFVTGRPESDRSATEKNLSLAGYHHWSGIVLRSDHCPPAKSIIPFKSTARKMIEQKGYVIIASIGDQQSDLQGGYAEKTFKLPNPYYFIP